jgi:RNA polymerase sigma-70 factor, ECF subfamily
MARMPSSTAPAQELEAAWRIARAAWPAFAVDESAFYEHLQRAVVQGKAPTVLHLACADLYLAFACFVGDEAARGAFEQDHVAHVPAFVAHLVRDGDAVEEIKQRLRERLLWGKDGLEPRIGRYLGTGPLAGWVRVTAIRIALDLRGETRSVAADLGDDGIALPESVADPELEFFRMHYRAEFKAALAAALSALEAEEISALQLHHGEGMTVDALATLFRVGRSTIVRRLARTRERIAKVTRKELAGRLHLRPSEVDSMVGLVMSQLDLSLSVLLKRRGSRD